METIFIPPFVNSRSFSVPIREDLLIEGDETFIAMIVQVTADGIDETSINITRSQSIGIIEDNDGERVMSF